MLIQNDRDLRVAYEILYIIWTRHADQIKKSIREYRDRTAGQARIVRSDWDSLLVVFPPWQGSGNL